jgi:VIT1/CCC1 family predicted Fe2+/Mn2+ transporter
VSETVQPAVIAPAAAPSQTQSKAQTRRAAAKARRQALRTELKTALQVYREQRIAQKADKGNPPRTKPERQPAKPALIGGIVAVVVGGLFLVAVFTFLPPLTALISIATLTLGVLGILTGIILILLAIFNVL